MPLPGFSDVIRPQSAVNLHVEALTTPPSLRNGGQWKDGAENINGTKIHGCSGSFLIFCGNVTVLNKS
jgi:hypothetical protein